MAGDETALYNALLLTLRDAADVPGRKVVIVFSNGPDTASAVAPDDVRAVAEDEGIPIYVISTKEVNKDPISRNVFRRLTGRTGGRAFFALSWQKQSEAFSSIREELGSSYTVTYYPQPNPNAGLAQHHGRGRQRQYTPISHPHPERLPAQAVAVPSRRQTST